MFRIKCGDKVIILSGKDKGKIGDVFKIFKSKKTGIFRAFVSGINVAKRHCKKNEKRKLICGIYTIELSINISKLAIINKVTGKIDKIRADFITEGTGSKKVRVFKSNRLRYDS